jgi:hypothetical protein
VSGPRPRQCFARGPGVRAIRRLRVQLAAIKESWHSLDFTLLAPTHDWKSWSEPDPGYLPRTYSGDYGRAFIIDVTYPFTGQTNFWDVLLVMPTIDGTSWTVSEVR